MLHLIYILAFTIISLLAITNLLRSLVTVSYDSQRRYPSAPNAINKRTLTNLGGFSTTEAVIHPELLDNNGQPIKEPLLVMRSVSVEDARQRLDAIYNSSSEDHKDINDEP